MKKNKVESYVPAMAFYDGKRELSGERFRNSLAVLDLKNGIRVIASRGESFEKGMTVLPDAREDMEKVRRMLDDGRTVVAQSSAGVLLLFGGAMANGLIPALSPAGNPFIPEELPRLLGRQDLILSPTLGSASRQEERRTKQTAELCRELSLMLAESDRIFGEDANADFRRHCAEVAAFAGCRVDVRSLPVGDFPLTETERRRWTLLLLCLFLHLRGSDAKGPSFRMNETDRKTLITGVDYQGNDDSAKRDAERFAFLEHPAFHGVGLERTESGGYRLTVTLNRRGSGTILRAFSAAERFVFTLEPDDIPA